MFPSALIPTPPDIGNFLEVKVCKSVALLESVPPADNDYYCATSIISLIEYSVRTDVVQAGEKGDLSRLLDHINSKARRLPLISMNNGQNAYKEYLVILATEWELMLRSFGSSVM